MSNSLGQFVVGFVLAFSPAPFVGMGTYAVVQAGSQADEMPMTVEREQRPQYGSPLDREYQGGGSGVYFTVDGEPTHAAPASAEPQQGEMEVETDCKRRKKAKKVEPKPAPKQPEVPPL